ncbi:MAG: tRNA preQ1(34) S-adenosylmethionine ribosyltransferase-isomerase QueA [Polyangiaceae bacterium]
MRTELIDYELPEELIALRPPSVRDAGRLLVLARDGLEHARVRGLAERVPPGALVVLNDTRVLRARLLGTRPGGGKVELLLLKRLGAPGEVERWSAFGRPAKRLRSGMPLEFGPLRVRVLGRGLAGELEVELDAEGGVGDALERVGHVPIPPYLRRDDEPLDTERYQTVFAREAGSVAAPTAGLHLSTDLLERLRARDVDIGYTTLHVGAGTFQPVSVDDLDQHPMHAEDLRVSAELVEKVERARARARPVVAVGTTVVRALESARDESRPGFVRELQGETRLLIQPGHRFHVVDALLTNFHLPKSTLLALVAAFAGLDAVRRAYAEAISHRYRFLSYGDAMWIPERAE